MSAKYADLIAAAGEPTQASPTPAMASAAPTTAHDDYADVVAAAASKPPTAPDTSLPATVASHVAHGAALGLGERLGVGLDTVVSKAPEFLKEHGANSQWGRDIDSAIAGKLRGAYEYLNDAWGGHPGLTPVTNPSLSYDQRLGEMRARDAAQEAAHPLGAALSTGTGAALTGMIPGAGAARAIEAGKGFGAAALQGAKANVGQGMAAGYGESNATDLHGVLTDTVAGGMLGAGLGAVAEPVAGILTRKAGKRMAKDITRELVEGTGEGGAALRRPKLQVAADEKDIVNAAIDDPELAKAIRGGTPAAEGLKVVRRKIEELGPQFQPHYDVVDHSIREGRLPHAQSQITGLEQAANDAEAQAAAVEADAQKAQRAIDRNSKKAKEIVNPEMSDEASRRAATRGVEKAELEEQAKALRTQATGLRERAKGAIVDAESGKGVDVEHVLGSLDQHIDEMDSDKGNAFNTKTIQGFRDMRDDLASRWKGDKTVSTWDLRRNVSSRQKNAQGTLGNNLTPSESRELKTNLAGWLKDYLDDHLDRAANNHLARQISFSPEAGEQAARGADAVSDSVAKIRDLNTRYSALKNIESALESREEKEALGHKTGFSKAHGLAALISAAAAGGPTHSLPMAAAGLVGAAVAPTAYRVASGTANRALANLTRAAADGSNVHALMRQALEAGIPRATIEGIVRYVVGQRGPVSHAEEATGATR